MQDHIPDALITAFERQYDSSWNDPQLRNERLAMRYGWAAAMEAKQCLHQIQDPAPATAMDALREAEAALEVAMARILKADPGHSICVTSEAKALVAVRAALAAPAAVAVPDGWKLVPELPTQDMCESAKYGIDARLSVFKWADGYKAMLSSAPEFAALAATPAVAPVVLPEPVPTPCRSMFATQREYADAMAQHRKNWAEIEAERAMLATGGQAQADMPDSFREWFAQNYPADTIIVDPDWHAKSIFRMAQAHARLAAPQAQADARDAATFEQRMSDWQHGDALDAERYRWLRSRDLETISQGGVFAGMTPQNVILNEEDLDQAVDAAIAAAKGEQQ